MPERRDTTPTAGPGGHQPAPTMPTTTLDPTAVHIPPRHTPPTAGRQPPDSPAAPPPTFHASTGCRGRAVTIPLAVQPGGRSTALGRSTGWWCRVVRRRFTDPGKPGPDHDVGVTNRERDDVDELGPTPAAPGCAGGGARGARVAKRAAGRRATLGFGLSDPARADAGQRRTPASRRGPGRRSGRPPSSSRREVQKMELTMSSPMPKPAPIAMARPNPPPMNRDSIPPPPPCCMV